MPHERDRLAAMRERTPVMMPRPPDVAPIGQQSSAAPSQEERRQQPTETANSLQKRAITATAVLFLYLASVAAFAIHERAAQFHTVEEMAANHERHEFLATANGWLTHSIITVQGCLNARECGAVFKEIDRDIAEIEPNLSKAAAIYPVLARSATRFSETGTAFTNNKSIDTLVSLRDVEQQVIAHIEPIMKVSEMQGYEYAQQYRARSQRTGMIVVSANLAGLVTFTLWVSTFFRRLTRDIKRLETWATSVSRGGYQGEPLRVTRSDELGAVMSAVNKMQSDLRIMEQKRQMVREQRFHQEKMAAMGSLAAAVAHEVNNPIDAIAGIAQSTIAAVDSDSPPDAQLLRSQAQLVLGQAERIGLIVRQLSELSTPHRAEPELLDLNQLVQATCAFLQYDRRFASIRLDVQAEYDLPPILCIADHLTQVLMNLLINAADACEDLLHRKPVIRVATSRTLTTVELSICDNGPGMSPEVLSKVFDEAYTTKPPDKGRGIGLFLCKTLIDRSGGQIKLESARGVGTCARVTLPIASEDRAR